MFARSLVLASAVALVASQSLNLTAPCTSALTGVVANSEASACLNPAALLQIAGATNSSIIPPINNWLTGLCAAPACSNATLTAVIANVTSGCSTELNTLMGNTGDGYVPTFTGLVLQGYPTARKALCLKDGSDICVTKILNTLQASWGDLSINGIISFSLGIRPLNLTVLDEVICSNCAKAAYTVAHSDFPTLSLSNYLGEEATAKCGASFADGQTPAGISFSASNATNSTNASNNGTTNNNNSASRLAGSVVGVAAVFVSTAFVILV